MLSFSVHANDFFGGFNLFSHLSLSTTILLIHQLHTVPMLSWLCALKMLPNQKPPEKQVWFTHYLCMQFAYHPTTRALCKHKGVDVKGEYGYEPFLENRVSLGLLQKTVVKQANVHVPMLWRWRVER